MFECDKMHFGPFFGDSLDRSPSCCPTCSIIRGRMVECIIHAVLTDASEFFVFLFLFSVLTLDRLNIFQWIALLSRSNYVELKNNVNKCRLTLLYNTGNRLRIIYIQKHNTFIRVLTSNTSSRLLRQRSASSNDDYYNYNCSLKLKQITSN